MDSRLSDRPGRVIHIPDDGFRYPVGTRLNIDRAEGSGVELGVTLNPHGAWRVAGCSRVEHRGVPMLYLTLEPVRRA